MDPRDPLTNTERRDLVAFLVDRYQASARRPADVLDDDERRRFAAGDAREQRRLFFKLLCYGALSAQPAPEAVIAADWQRLVGAGVPDDVFDGSFDVRRYAVAAPVARNDSKGKVIDFVRLAETQEFWARLLPQPPDPMAVVDVLHGCSGGALKSRAFWVVREMLRYGLWQADGLARFACVPDGRVRKRASRMGLIDLAESADTLDDMKAASAGLHAVLGLAGNGARELHDLPVSLADQRCEICDGGRMAGCPAPHCRFRRVLVSEAAA